MERRAGDGGRGREGMNERIEEKSRNSSCKYKWERMLEAAGRGRGYKKN